ncbi:MAG: Dihydroxyacetone kinase family protein [Hydrogenibacillus schlegelii]|uniref:Dihydroxyacetone kinase family protein n=1 Tax=Hydrogenibacillus schlegelii TaxID=1484 RepID=A0A2T5GEV6_HYDSH|nr:DAK2 domain-containing protein [Hydrogenibacillus schlegelii]PTQ54712.1 MAG: Dihydroxyacetone kinase family protein [Hydrogenibacillus schlegelii]
MASSQPTSLWTASGALTGAGLLTLLEAGLDRLRTKKAAIDRLNVFPVPDGDTGTNMALTMAEGVAAAREAARVPGAGVGAVAKAFSRGVLMGARGNSGVILSQLFRGFAERLAGSEAADVRAFAEALEAGVKTAYAAVMKPVEGTILTVAREAARSARQAVDGGRTGPFGRPAARPRTAHPAIAEAEALGAANAEAQAAWTALFAAWLEAAREALAKTPELLPTLRAAGVVDAGGSGLIVIFEGMAEALAGGLEGGASVPAGASGHADDRPPEGRPAAGPEAETFLGPEDHLPPDTRPEELRYGYCTEVIVRLEPNRASAFDLEAFREAVSRFGDSLLVAADDDLVKVHVHSETPGAVLDFVQGYGELVKIKIDNMREQIRRRLARVTAAPGGPEAGPAAPANHAREGTAPPAKAQAIVAVVAGEGFRRIFKSLGVDVVVEGGQTMNPSAEAIVRAIRAARAETVFVLPNNKNVVLAAEQAAGLSGGAVVVPTTSVAAGLAAALAFHPAATPEENAARMQKAAEAVRAIEFTRAVRDAVYDGESIREGEWLALSGGALVARGEDLVKVALSALREAVDDEASVVTAYFGAGLPADVRDRLPAAIRQAFPDVDVETHDGGQPVYPLILAVE